uniref:Tyrosine-protein phosphatase domain-containing protein n=1 Tax=Parastrongyloides trichosuri TaxID=131310 RepID=A0A0N4ZA77_PARTI
MAQNTTGPFPSAPKNVLPSGHIEYNLTHNSTSDVVMVKCPEDEYKHSNSLKGFTMEKILQKPVGFARQFNELFIWSAYRISDVSKNTLMITCGHFEKDIGTGAVKKMYWKINVKWTVPTNVFEIAHAVDANGINANPMSDENKIVGKQERAYEQPNFIVDGKQERAKSAKNEKIFVVRSISSGKRKYNIRLIEMENLNLKEFYIGKEILSQRVIYLSGEVKPIGDKEAINNGELSVKGYEIIQFSYSALTESKFYEEVVETFFFGPDKHYENPKPITVNFTKNDGDIEANCPINQYDYAFLSEIKIGSNFTIKINDSIAEGDTVTGITKSGDNFVHKIKNETLYHIHCIYETPDGIIEQVKVYTDISRYETIIDEGGKLKIHKLKDEDTEKKLQEMKDKMKEADKSSFQKLKEKLGTGGVVGIGIALLFVLSCICFLIYYFTLRKIIKACLDEKEKRAKYPNVFVFWENVKVQSIGQYSKMAPDEKYVCKKTKQTKIIKILESEDVVIDSGEDPFNETLVKCSKEIGNKIQAYYVNDVSPKRTYIISDGPRKESIMHFFKMLFLENVSVVVSIIYRNPEEPENNARNPVYWPVFIGLIQNLSLKS